MRISIQQKIFSGYLLFILMAMLINLYIIMQLRAINKIATELEQMELRKIATIKDMESIWKNKKRIEIRYLSFHEEKNLQEYREKSGEFQCCIDTLLNTTVKTEDLEKINDINLIYRKYEFLFDRRVIAEKSIHAKERIKFLEQRLEGEDKDMQRDMELLLKMVEKNLELARHRSMTISQQTTNFAIIMAGLILVIGITAGSVVAFGITRPLRKLTLTTNTIAQGKFKERVIVHSNDEVGDLAQAFNHMAAQLDKLDEVKADFISHASHELRTPVAAIKNAASLFAEVSTSELNGDQKKLLAILTENANRLSHLINDLLDVARLELNQVQLSLEKVQLADVLDRCVTAIEPLAQEKKLTVHKQYSTGLTEIAIDQEKIEQVVTNILSNAIKFTPENGRITVATEDQPEAIKTSITDTGIGIPADKLLLIFSKFQQIKEQRHAAVKGTGLGLTISKYIIEAHGGKIWANSELGSGSTFSFILPKK